MRRLPVVPAAVAAIAARASYARLRAHPPGGADTWTRVNHRGEPVTLLEGPAVALGGIAGTALAGALAGIGLAGTGLAGTGRPGTGRPGAGRPGTGGAGTGGAGIGRVRPPTAVSAAEVAAVIVAGAGAAVFGGYDDLAGDSASKGFGGHLGALRRGELTTGAVKLAGISATGFAAALIVARRRTRAGDRAAVAAAADVIIDAGLVAGGANLLNLFDLRPGRAIKVAIAASGLLAAAPGSRADAGTGPAGASPGQLAAAPLAAAVALLPDDLGERAMLGDAGANAIGAMLGVAATALPRPARAAALGVVVGLTAASERVSFTKVIERTGLLRWLDRLGRRPAEPLAAGPRAAEPRAQARAATEAADGTAGAEESARAEEPM